MESKLYVGNISFKATEEQIKSLFVKIGTVVSFKLVTDARTGKPKGFAFVEMASTGEAQQAIEVLHGSLLLDRPLSVTVANTQLPRERRDLDASSDKSSEQ